MWFLFLDEFGNPGHAQPSSTSYHPAFGYVGILVNAREFEQLSLSFLNLKCTIVRNGQSFIGSINKGFVNVKRLGQTKLTRLLHEIDNREALQNSDLEGGKATYKRAQAHATTLRLLSKIKDANAEIFVFGVEKSTLQLGERKPKLQVDLLEELIERAMLEAKEKRDEIFVIFDKHSSDPARGVKMKDYISHRKYHGFIRKTPSFCDSQWSQGIQIADWLSFLVGKLLRQHCIAQRPEYEGYAREYLHKTTPLFSRHSAFIKSNGEKISLYVERQLDLPLPSQQTSKEIQQNP
jgi:Protein of unknown function (DUF3800)